jgi:hypothetical protein
MDKSKFSEKIQDAVPSEQRIAHLFEEAKKTERVYLDAEFKKLERKIIVAKIEGAIIAIIFALALALSFLHRSP